MCTPACDCRGQVLPIIKPGNGLFDAALPKPPALEIKYFSNRKFQTNTRNVFFFVSRCCTCSCGVVLRLKNVYFGLHGSSNAKKTTSHAPAINGVSKILILRCLRCSNSPSYFGAVSNLGAAQLAAEFNVGTICF